MATRSSARPTSTRTSQRDSVMSDLNDLCQAFHDIEDEEHPYPRCIKPAGHEGPHADMYGREWSMDEKTTLWGLAHDLRLDASQGPDPSPRPTPTTTQSDDEPAIPWWDMHINGLIQRLKGLHQAKRKRYAGNRHPLDNYLRSGEVLSVVADGIDPDLGEEVRKLGALPIMLARIQEKIVRVATMIGQEDFFHPLQGAEMAETLTDTYLDIANIALLMDAETRRVREEHDRAKQ